MGKAEKMNIEPTDDWKGCLAEERKELLERTLKLKKFLDNPEAALSNVEWDMLKHQYGAMHEYLQALTDRCVFYELLEAGNLNLDYSGPCKRW